MEGVDSQHELYHFDGIIRVFFRDLQEFTDPQESATRAVRVSLTESFAFAGHRELSATRPQPQPFSQHPVIQNTLEDLWFAVCDSVALTSRPADQLIDN